MELEGFQRCMQFLLSCGMLITAIVTDRHLSIAKHMREVFPNIKHYFDLWHLKKSKYFSKNLTQHPIHMKWASYCKIGGQCSV